MRRRNALAEVAEIAVLPPIIPGHKSAL
jgi:hypothetical protein